MKRERIFFGSLMVLAFCLAVTPVWAQMPDLSIWVGKWFQSTQKDNGVTFSGSTMGNFTDTGTYYFKVTEWDSSNKLFKGISYPTDDYEPKEITLNVIAGNDLDFLCWGYFDTGEEGFSGIVWRIQGKMSGGGLKSATIKSLGGFFWRKSSETYEAGQIVISAKLIPESKVPPGIPR